MMTKFRIVIPYRTFKNFGHKRQPVAPITILWHGFLTFSFIGLGLEWKRVSKFIFGEDDVPPSAESLEEKVGK